jgi:hypothetical protein
MEIMHHNNAFMDVIYCAVRDALTHHDKHSLYTIDYLTEQWHTIPLWGRAMVVNQVRRAMAKQGGLGDHNKQERWHTLLCKQGSPFTPIHQFADE